MQKFDFKDIPEEDLPFPKDLGEEKDDIFDNAKATDNEDDIFEVENLPDDWPDDSQESEADCEVFASIAKDDLPFPQSE